MTELAARARRASDELRSEGTPVRFIRAVFVPEDDACLHLYRAPSAEAVREAASRAALASRGVVEALALVPEDRGE